MAMLSKNDTIIKSELRILHIDSNCNTQVENFLNTWMDHSDLISLQTSGSTGAKKRIDAPKNRLVESARMTGNFFGFSDKTIALVCLPIDYISGKMMLIRTLEHKMNAIICEASNPLGFPDNLSPNFAAMTPYQYQKCLSENPEKLLKIDTVLLGGGVLSQTLITQIQLNKQKVFHSYGMTETYSHVALRKINTLDEPFQALPGVALTQAKDQTLVISAQKLGIISMKTNDIVRFVAANHFFFVGRKDNVINSGGIKLHPEEIEEKIAPLFPKHNFFIFGLPDETFGEKLVLFVESKKPLDLQMLVSRMAKYEFPKKTYFMERFIYTETGKINRNLTAKSVEI